MLKKKMVPTDLDNRRTGLERASLGCVAEKTFREVDGVVLVAKSTLDAVMP